MFFSCHNYLQFNNIHTWHVEPKMFLLSLILCHPQAPFVVVYNPSHSPNSIRTVCTFPIFYCHRRLCFFFVCSVSVYTAVHILLAYLLILFGSFLIFSSLSTYSKRDERVLCCSLDITAITEKMATKSLSNRFKML